MNPTRLMRTTAEALFASDMKVRYNARHWLFSRLMHRFGFRLYNRNLYWMDDSEYLSAWRQFPEGDKSIKDRKYNLYWMAQSVRNLPGDTVECGVFNGGSSYLICLATAAPGTGRLHHAFDSYEGLSEPESIDKPIDKTAIEWKKHDLSVSLERAQKNLSHFDFVRYHKGWIPDCFPDVADRKFAFVHIDVDLYQPTYDSLAFFYDRMVLGGIILCDDYGYTTCPGAKKAFDEFIADKPEARVISLTTGQGFIVKHG